MLKTIISDTSCLIILANIGELEILHKVYGTVVTTPEIAEEFGETLPAWISIESVSDKYRIMLLEMQLDRGESSAISLALEISGSILILDDYKARKIASFLGLKFTGTLGVLIKAKHSGIIRGLRPLIEKMKEKGFRISTEIELAALSAAGE